jgi:hypothetical protein
MEVVATFGREVGRQYAYIRELMKVEAKDDEKSGQKKWSENQILNFKNKLICQEQQQKLIW